MASSIWPFDYYKQLHDVDRADPYELLVFLASPFSPEYKYGDLHKFCQLACDKISESINIKIKCVRGDTPTNPEIIHQDIWNYIQRCDALIFDISDVNPNVMIELGVASATRDNHQVILIKDFESEIKSIFDIAPVRYLTYHRNFTIDGKFLFDLMNALQFALTPAPFVPELFSDFSLPVQIDYQNYESFSKLLGPPSLHKRKLIEGLEFGSLNFFRNSWLTLGREEFSNIYISSTMKFTELNPSLEKGDSWIGISLRSQHFYANFGHLFYIKADGSIIYARPKNDKGLYEDLELGKLSKFDISEWVTFEITFNESILKISINEFEKEFIISDNDDVPFCYNSGMIRFQTYKTKACIKCITAEYPNSEEADK